MKQFAERNQEVIGAVGIGIVVVSVVAVLQYDSIPFVSDAEHYTAYFSEAAGLTEGAPVEVAGYKVGEVSEVSLDGAQVAVTFTIDEGIRLGDRTEAAIKTKTLLGSRLLAITSRGTGELPGPIPLDRTTSPYELPAALGDLSSTISDLDTGSLNASLTTLAQTFQNTPSALSAALNGVTRLSDALGKRDNQLRSLLGHANNVTDVLAQRSDQLVSLVDSSNALLAQLNTERAAVDSISTNISHLAQQVSQLVADNKQQLRPALDRLNGVLTILDNHKADLQKSIRLLNQYALSLGESVSGGPFFSGYITNLIPGQFIQPFIDAAFSDLGLDPAVLPPSLLTDPQTGQLATPALPVPFPRTGQGGDPRLTLPDAITGGTGDPRYPYHAPPPQPAPGGPPPGPPAGYVPGDIAPTVAPIPVDPAGSANGQGGSR